MRFIIYKEELLLVYSPSFDSFSIPSTSIYYDEKKENENLRFDEFVQRREFYKLKNTFIISYDKFRNYNKPNIGDYYISIGYLKGDYICLNKNIFNIEHNIYFSKEIKFNKKLFIAYDNISIISKIDKILDKDLYIDCGENEGKGHILIDSYLNIVNTFPNAYEVKKYIDYRISINLEEYFIDKDLYKKKFEKYISKKSVCKDSKTLKLSNKNKLILTDEAILNNLIALKHELQKLVDNSESLVEKDFQEYILQVIKILFPKYIYVKREVKIKGIDKHDKIPDYILIDYSGFVDTLEIKKPEAQLLLKNADRNNYVPSKGLSSAVQQLEKYIICLNRNGIKGEENLKAKFLGVIPEKLDLKCINSKGILIMGDTKGFNIQQKNDFEIIKRQYKDIMDIYTYDELLAMLDNAIASFK